MQIKTNIVTKMLRIDDYAAPGRVQARSERPALLDSEACRGTVQYKWRRCFCACALARRRGATMHDPRRRVLLLLSSARNASNARTRTARLYISAR